jgi:CRISPR-associated protein Csd1
MILPALLGYYNRLEADPQGDVAPFGFSREKISFCLVLGPDGSLHERELQDVRREVDGKMRAQLMVVPDRGGRSGTLIKPNFLWDNTGYVLGRDSKGKPERSRKTFEAFRELHLRFAEGVDDEGLHALCRFLSTWDPAEAETLGKWEEACDANIVFRLRGTHEYVHDSVALREAWLRFVTDEIDSQPGYSLATGEHDDLARLHPLVQGVVGAQSTGASLVGFNLDAFTSYGKKQSYNAPLGVRDAFRYTTALNRLLADTRRRVRIGDATVVFWSDRPTPFEDLFGVVINEPSAEDPALNDRVRAFLERLKQGRVGDSLEDADVPFYVLGLSANASRLSVRFWLPGSVGQFAERLDQHAKDLQMSGARPDDPPLIIRRLLLETAREAKDIPPLLAGAVARAVLTGGAYPDALYGAVLRRIHADRRMNYRRAAILKACLVRKHRTASLAMEVPVSLNTDHPDPAYHLGRLFAALEKTQEDALGTKLNRTIKDSYFSSASATPATVFPRLVRLSQHHIAALEGGRRVNREKLIQEIVSHLQGFPAHLPLEKQGLFHIAYYHQRQAFFEKKSDEAPSAEEQPSIQEIRG